MLAAGGMVTASAVGTACLYLSVMKRKHTDVQRTTRMAGADWEQYKEFLEERKAYVFAQEHEEVYQTSFDGLKLHAFWFPPKEDEKGKKKVVICFHGYTSQALKDFLALSQYYLEAGYGMLQPDARAHGGSEGEYIGFGCLDRHDAMKWINWVIETCGEDVEILLHGISMGGATVLMASGLELPDQVKGIVSDCAFTSPKEVFTHVLHTMFHMPAFPIIPMTDVVNQKLAGYGMDECNARDEVAKAKIPILFIHGSKDTFIPPSMCQELYDCCASPKKMLIVEGAAHAESYFKDRGVYEEALNQFTKEIFKD
ncbi:MAG: alpha/beta hydrolase [Lachnospiraceae bacterium]|nr:alpha/beta hydrolase [Lachnospiraceae bacterium]